MWGRPKRPAQVGARLTPREWIVVLKVLHILARLEVIEQVWTTEGKIKWRRARRNPPEE